MSSLYHSLNNVLLQDMPQKDYEVIAISHGVSEGTEGILLNDNFNFVQNKKKIFVPINQDIQYQPNYVRNQGIAQAEGKLVLFLHDNVDLIGRDWLRKLWRASKYGKNAVYTKKIVYRYKKQEKDGTILILRVDEVFGFYAQQDAIPLKYLKIVGGFDEAYDGDTGMDDVDLMKRCQLVEEEEEGGGGGGVGCYFNGEASLLSIKHNLRDLFPEQKTLTDDNNNKVKGEKNRKIFFEEKGFTFP